MSEDEALTPATDDAVTPEMLAAGMRAFGDTTIVGGGAFTARALSNAYRAMVAARLEAVEEKR